MGWRVLTIAGGLAAAALGCCVASAQSLDAATWWPNAATPWPSATNYSLSLIQEVRFGAFAHNVIHNEDAPVDVSIETLSSPITFPGWDNPAIARNPWINWFFIPRLNMGGMINTGGKTSYAFGGFTWRIPIYGPLFFEGELGGAINDAPRHPETNRVDMGCVSTFRESGGFGAQLTKNFDVIFSVEHISHASFCTHTNPGITDFGVRIGYRF
jgi:hypothetical protein